MRLIAVAQQLTGEYGTVTAGQEFECREDIAIELLRSGSARQPDPPRVLYETKPRAGYETKVIVPEAPEASPRPPFRNMPLPDAQPAPVAPKGDPVLPAADVPPEGTADPRGRRERKGPGSGR